MKLHRHLQEEITTKARGRNEEEKNMECKRFFFCFELKSPKNKRILRKTEKSYQKCIPNCVVTNHSVNHIMCLVCA